MYNLLEIDQSSEREQGIDRTCRCQILGGSLREDILLGFEEDFLSAGFRPRTLVADGSSRARWKAGDLLLKFKKNPDEKYFFIMEKFDFEKIF